jgi:hypothetical protein
MPAPDSFDISTASSQGKARGTTGGRPSPQARGLVPGQVVRDEDHLTQWAKTHDAALDFTPREWTRGTSAPSRFGAPPPRMRRKKPPPSRTAPPGPPPKAPANVAPPPASAPPVVKTRPVRDAHGQVLKSQRNNAYGPYYFSTVKQRHEFYDYIQEKYGYARDSRWFQAAAFVTGADGIGAVDRMNVWMISDDTEAFLRTGNEYLSFNNVTRFADGFEYGQDIPGLEGKRGKALDYGMVRMEQQALQEFMAKYFARNPKVRDKVISEINDSFTRTRWWQLQKIDPVKAVSSPQQKAALDYALGEIAKRDHPFDFARPDDRIFLGERMIDFLRGGH